MKKTLNSLLFILLFACASSGAEPQFPAYTGHVNDLVNIIDQENAGKLKALAYKLKENTGAELAVVTVKTTYPLDTKAYATQLFEKWGIGRKEKDNGVLILFVLKDRRIEVEVGYGLEGTLTDGFVGQALDKYAIPQFREKNYGRGLYLTALVLYDRISKDFANRPQSKLEQVNMNMYSILMAVSVIIVVFLLALLGGTLIGAVFAGIAGSVVGYFLAGAAGAAIGFIIGIMISTGGYYGGFGGWGGGSFGGGGFGQGGGFGGFGGGRSGGGGAGRSF